MAGNLWERMVDRAPRQLRFTRAGRVLVSIALAAGLAAMNTGNNLLFFGWGMVLSAIVVSGVLSEATLRALWGNTDLPQQARVQESALIPVTVHNASKHLPAYAVEVLIDLRGPEGTVQAAAPYQLRMPPHSEVALFAQFVPQRRGVYEIVQMAAKTAYPFGFFEKSRRLRIAANLNFWCFPKSVDVSSLVQAVAARLGDAPLPQAGSGDDFFSLRPYRAGDDMRRVAWRRSARMGRWVVVETEAVTGRELVLEMQLIPSATPEAVEHTISTLGSLAEGLLQRGFRVGIWAPGTLLAPASGGRQRWEILLALAKLQAASPMPRPPWGERMARLALVGEAAMPPKTFNATILRVPPQAMEQPPGAAATQVAS